MRKRTGWGGKAKERVQLIEKLLHKLLKAALNMCSLVTVLDNVGCLELIVETILELIVAGQSDKSIVHVLLRMSNRKTL